MQWTNGAAGLCLALSLSGCGTSQEVVTQTENIRTTPPAELTEPIPIPVMLGDTNGALLAWAMTLRETLREAAGDRAALRQWSKEEDQE